MYADANKDCNTMLGDDRKNVGDGLSWKDRLVPNGYLQTAGKGKIGIFGCSSGSNSVDAAMLGEKSQRGYGMWRSSGHTDSWMFTGEVKYFTPTAILYPTKNNNTGANGEKFSPSEFTFVIDSCNTNLKQSQYNINRSRNGGIGAVERIHLLHGKRANSLMGDGHVESMNEEAFEAIGRADGVFQRN